MKTKYLMLLSEMIYKMDIKEELQNLNFNTGNDKEDKEKLGAALITLLITNIYKCEKEVYTFVATYKGYFPEKPIYSTDDTPEQIAEKDLDYENKITLALKNAENENIVEIFKEISKLPGIADFLSIA